MTTRPGIDSPDHRGRTGLAMIHDGRITDGKTILLLQWAALDGPFAPPPHRADRSPH